MNRTPGSWSRNLASLKKNLGIVSHAAVNARYRRYVAQRLVLDVRRRERKAEHLVTRLPRRDGRPSIGASAKARVLADQGFVMLSDALASAAVAEMRDYFSQQECSDPYRPELGRFTAPAQVPAGSHVAAFDHATIAKAPHALALANDPQILEIVGEVLGAKPTISLLAAWWSVPSSEGPPKEAENFHRDVEDWRFVKLFLYLTDVDEDNGPHVFIPGSHRQDALGQTRRFSEEEVASAFGSNGVQRFIGPAGTCFLEHTYGVHRGFPPRSKPRLIYQVQYSLRPVYGGPRKPVAVLGQDGVPASVDRYVNRVYCRSG
jgi:hypothetical protein